jgi:hypothetical protein
MSGHSRQYAALANCASDIEDRLRLNRCLISDLNEAGLISKRLYEVILSPRSLLTMRGKVGEMISVIKGAVELDPRNFNKFLDILKQNTECDGLVKILNCEHERLESGF